MSQTISKKAKDAKALPLSDTLRDLALLRASDVDLAALLPGNAATLTKPDSLGDENKALEDSSEFIREARKALKVHDRGDAELLGRKLDEVDRKYEDLLAGLAR